MTWSGAGELVFGETRGWVGRTWQSGLRSARAITCLALMQELYQIEVALGPSGPRRFRAEVDLPIAWTMSDHMQCLLQLPMRDHATFKDVPSGRDG
jgi:hypothetical protein